MRNNPTPLAPARPGLRLAAGPAAVAVLTVLGVTATLAPHRGGPGATCDELYHVAAGKRLVLAIRHEGLGFFSPESIRRNFPWRPGGPPVHPPLGNWILGWTHHLFDPAPEEPNVVSLAAARFAPALGLGLLTFLVGLWMAVAEGPFCGTVAAAAVPLVPRVFGHGHLAALDLLTAAFFTAALVALAEAVRRGGRPRQLAAAGVVWGLAMLVRLHGLLLLPTAALWLVWRLRRRAGPALAAWLLAGGATFFVGWPWLWLAPIAHLRLFLASATGRQPLRVFYAGQVWADHDVPWHYPLVMFLVALPVGLLLLGGLGLWAKRRQQAADTGYWLAIGTLAFLLGLFAWPGVPVYDGVRLFLMVFPLWAISVGVGAKWVVEQQAWKSIGERVRMGLVGMFVLLQGVPLAVFHPLQLSHYSLLVGGLAGAERLGFESTYWGDAVTEPLLAVAAAGVPGERVLYGPNLAPFQAPAVQISSPSLLDGGVELVGWEPAAREVADCRIGVFYRRKADLGEIPRRFWDAEVLAERRVQGVWLARVVRLEAAAE